MIIGLDISQIVYKGTGVARFTEGLVHAILSYDTKNTWTFVFFGLRQQPEPELVQHIKESRHTLITRSIPSSVLRLLHNTIHRQTNILTFAGIPTASFDWFITSDWTEPMLPCKKATIVHDLVFKRYPQTVHRNIRDTQEERLGWVARESKLIFTDSEATAADLKQHYIVPSEKIVINYPGNNFESFIPAHVVSFEELQENHAIPEKYILTVGKLEPRKNIARLLEAYAHIETDTELVIVGMDGWGDMPKTNDKRVHFAGYVSDEELVTLYKHATCFAMPSLYEGFGYPVIEAMKYGCPVLTSNTSSLLEIAGDAAVLCDSEKVDSIREGLQKILTDTQLQYKLRTKGHEQAAKYSWERYYNTLVESLHKNNV